MQFLISPAKTLDFESPSPIQTKTECRFLNDSEKLIQDLKQLTAVDIGKLMGISDKLAELNHQRFKRWKFPFNTQEAKQALYAFKGDVYTGIDAYCLSTKERAYLHEHLKILSGLYGILRPTDEILPYRLEMGTKFENSVGANLYTFWADRLTESLDLDLRKDDNILINLASNEYFKSIKPKKLSARIITPVFKDEKNGSFKVISFFAKKARGMMCRYASEHAITDPEKLKAFDRQGYFYNEDLSKGDEWVFTRFEDKK